MKRLLFLLLLSISAITSTNVKQILDAQRAICKEMCPYFKKIHPDKKIVYKEIEEKCKEGIKEMQKSCAKFMKLDEKTRRVGKQNMEKFTWNGACNEFCYAKLSIPRTNITFMYKIM